MFTTHFTMSALPFCEKIPTSRVFKDDRMTQGLARLQYLALSGSIALITGTTGVGKSTLINLFLENLPQNQYHPLYLHFTQVKSSGLLRLIALALGESSSNTKERLFLKIMHAAGKHNLILIIDEAHLLHPDALTDLRLLLSSALPNVPAPKILLSGQYDIKNTLRRPSLCDFAQRISVHYNLEPLSKPQTVSYIDFHLSSVDVSDKLFDPEVKNMIFDYSNGIPRRINTIATACLINAASRKLQTINTDILNQAISEINPF